MPFNVKLRKCNWMFTGLFPFCTIENFSKNNGSTGGKFSSLLPAGKMGRKFVSKIALHTNTNLADAIYTSPSMHVQQHEQRTNTRTPLIAPRETNC